MDHENGKYSASPPVLKKMIPQLLLSVSIFSFVFSYSSLYSSSSSSLVYSSSYKFHHNFSANYSFPFLSHIALNKNCLFLICNGLLVFLAKTSGLVRPPPEDSAATAAAATADLINDILQKRIGDGQQMPVDQELPPEEINQPEEEKKLEDRESNFRTETSSEDVSITIVESEEEGNGEKDEISDEGRTCWLFDDDVDDEGEQLCRQQFEEEEGDEEEKEELSTEELNQKFEDFIRKMKEEIMISDARQKVVALK